ncbi:hypothetical protein GIY23_14545 [Allosaccharopolyspora coralli]|uniref:Cobyrinic acid a,c-diamide synthase n=1 Tax=Allosaccharopolyspora coralli TaxID=2665642 RepID=A0A5Q3QGB3_9PSEU|nr:hypothetical protein [Allosaccharopolyspora coralli]QGK70575.1 hypothetical protein GIY23_14545 [Allosaccharopolyspora coralli]
MNRRVALPGAAELFRTTARQEAESTTEDGAQAEPAPVRGSGRRKHDSKITVYVSGTELLGLEQARLALRAEHDVVVDRGRIVREAVAVLLADLDERGDESILVRRLRGESES